MEADIFEGTFDDVLNKTFEFKPYFGYVYAIELDHGVKIGKTNNPHRRLTHLKRMFENYGKRFVKRIAVSPIHSNYSQNETALLFLFGDVRKDKTEIVNMSFDFVVRGMRKLEYVNTDEKSEERQQAFESLKETFMDLWGCTERMAQTVIDLNDGHNDIQIKKGGYDYWWFCINGTSYQLTRDSIIEQIVQYALHVDIDDVIDYMDMMEYPSEYDDIEANEPVSKWMIDAVAPYFGKIIIDSVKDFIRHRVVEYRAKYDLYLNAMKEIADHRGYEYSIPPKASYIQIMSENYDGLEPIPPKSIAI